MSSNTAGDGFGENIAALQADRRVIREHMFGPTPSNGLQDPASQPRRARLCAGNSLLAQTSNLPTWSSPRQHDPYEM